MITTVTLNVSVDKAYYIKGIVVPGTVARVQKCVNSAGGKRIKCIKNHRFLWRRSVSNRI